MHSALQGSAENWQPNFRHFLHPLFTKFDVQDVRSTSVATTAEPCGEKKTFVFVQILGGEELLKLVEKRR